MSTVNHRGLRARSISIAALLALASAPMLSAQTPEAMALPENGENIKASAPSNLLRMANPPLMAPIEKGYAFLGTSMDQLKKLLEGRKGSRLPADLASQSAGQRVRVESFWMALTEVTNRQYRVFVQAKSHIPPLHWFKAAEDAARMEHMKREAARKKECEAQKKVFKALPFDLINWWKGNWKENKWAIPEGEEDYPVTFVTYRDALDYCLWSGFRMPTEAEWIRGARGEHKNAYVWGEKWDESKCLNSENSRMRLKPVGSYISGKSDFGILDLAGSVYEWTSSPYVQFDTYQALYVRGSRTAIDPKFDPTDKVLKGGSYGVNDPRFATRVAHRAHAYPGAVAPQIGFRPVRSTALGMDHIQNLLKYVVRTELIDGSILPSAVVGEEHWMAEKIDSPSAIDGYCILKSHESLLFAPCKELTHYSLSSLHENSLKKEISLGIFTTTQELTTPKLKPGTYVVKYRGAGKPKKTGEEAKAEAEKKKADAKKADAKKDDKKKAKKKKEKKPKRPKPLSRKEKLKQEAEKKKQAEEEAKRKAEEEKKKQEAEAKKKAAIEAGDIPSLEGKDEQDDELALKAAVEIDYVRENILFYDAVTGQLVQVIPSASPPFEIVKGKAGEEKTTSTFGPAALEKMDEKGKPYSVPIRRFSILLPTTSTRTFVKLNLDLNK